MLALLVRERGELRLEPGLELLPDPRDREEPGRADLRQELDDLARVRADRHRAAADHGQVVVGAALGDVRRRQPRDHLGAALGEVDDVLDPRDQAHQVAMGELHALRRPGGAGGVDQGQQIVGLDRIDDLCGVELGVERLERLERRGRRRRRRARSACSSAGRFGVRLVEDLEEGSLDDRDLGLRRRSRRTGSARARRSGRSRTGPPPSETAARSIGMNSGRLLSMIATRVALRDAEAREPAGDPRRPGPRARSRRSRSVPRPPRRRSPGPRRAARRSAWNACARF